MYLVELFVEYKFPNPPSQNLYTRIYEDWAIQNSHPPPSFSYILGPTFYEDLSAIWNGPKAYGPMAGLLQNLANICFRLWQVYMQPYKLTMSLWPLWPYNPRMYSPMALWPYQVMPCSPIPMSLQAYKPMSLWPYDLIPPPCNPMALQYQSKTVCSHYFGAFLDQLAWRQYLS